MRVVWGAISSSNQARHLIVLGREYSMIGTPPDMRVGPEGLIPDNIEKKNAENHVLH